MSVAASLLAACDNALAMVPATPCSLGLAMEAMEALEPDIVARGPISLLLTRLEEWGHELARAGKQAS